MSAAPPELGLHARAQRKRSVSTVPKRGGAAKARVGLADPHPSAAERNVRNPLERFLTIDSAGLIDR